MIYCVFRLPFLSSTAIIKLYIYFKHNDQLEKPLGFLSSITLYTHTYLHFSYPRKHEGRQITKSFDLIHVLSKTSARNPGHGLGPEPTDHQEC
jgi:hypothetical protein